MITFLKKGLNIGNLVVVLLFVTVAGLGFYANKPSKIPAPTRTSFKTPNNDTVCVGKNPVVVIGAEKE